jgi:hypothetical protein
MCPFRFLMSAAWPPLGMNIRGDTRGGVFRKKHGNGTAKAGFRTDRTHLYKKRKKAIISKHTCVDSTLGKEIIALITEQSVLREIGAGGRFDRRLPDCNPHLRPQTNSTWRNTCIPKNPVYIRYFQHASTSVVIHVFEMGWFVLHASAFTPPPPLVWCMPIVLCAFEAPALFYLCVLVMWHRYRISTPSSSLPITPTLVFSPPSHLTLSCPSQPSRRADRRRLSSAPGRAVQSPRGAAGKSERSSRLGRNKFQLEKP